MVAKKKKAPASVPTAPVITKAKTHFLPRGRLVFGLVVIIVSVVDYLNYYSFPREISLGLLVLAGLWMIKMAFASGSYNRRKEIIKRYI